MRSIYLVRLVNDDGIIRKRFHKVEILNGGWTRAQFSQILMLKQTKSESIDNDGDFLKSELTLPVQSEICVPEVAADLMSCHPLHSMCSFERIQHDAVLLYFSPVDLLHKIHQVQNMR